MTVILFGLLGLCLGSFINALVWRLHEKRDFVSERSECTKCHHQLAWYDLLPVVSWVLLRGKCRYCKKSISVQYPLVELFTAGLYAGSYYVWPYALSSGLEWTAFGLWLIMLVLLVALLVYDARWYLLPDKLVFPLIGLAVLFAIIRTLHLEDMSILTALGDSGLGVLSVAGLYGGLYAVSKGAWVGFGDVKLGIAMGFILGWPYGLLAVFLANIIGLIVMLPGLMSHKLSAQSRVPFGPFLIIALVISLLFGSRIIDWYLATFLGW